MSVHDAWVFNVGLVTIVDSKLFCKTNCLRCINDIAGITPIRIGNYINIPFQELV